MFLFSYLMFKTSLELKGIFFRDQCRRFASVTSPKPAGHWNKVRNQKIRLKSIAKTLMIKTWWMPSNLSYFIREDWYNVSVIDVKSNGGTGLLARYNFSLYRCLKTVYPEHDWKVWKFSKVFKINILLKLKEFPFDLARC